MAKVMLIYLVLALTGLLWSPHSIEAKPFFFKFFDAPHSVSSTTRAQVQIPVVSTFVLTDFLARKLEFLAGLFSNKGSVSYSVGYNKGGHAVTTNTQHATTTTTTSRPISTTPLQTVFVPESTESMETASLATTEKTVVDGSQSIITSVRVDLESLGAKETAASATAALATAAPTTAGTTAATTAGTTAKPASIIAPTLAPTLATTFVLTSASLVPSTYASKFVAPFIPEYGPTFASITPSTTTSTTATATSGTPAKPAATEQPSSELTNVPYVTAAPTSVLLTYPRLVPSLAPIPESSTDNIIILSLFDQTSGSTAASAISGVTVDPQLPAQINLIEKISGSTSAPGSTSATVDLLLPGQITHKATLTSGFSVTEGTSNKRSYGYSDPNVQLFDASNEIINEIQKTTDLPEPERLELDIRT